MKTLALKIKNFFRIDKSLFTVEDQKGKLALFALTIPIFLENISGHFIGMLQTMMSANFMDGFFVDPSAIASAVSSPLISIASLVTVGMGIILSINLGRRRYEDCKTIIGTAFMVDMLICILLYSSCIIFPEELISLMGYNTPEYAEQFPYAVAFLRNRGWANMITHIPILFLGVLRCYGYTKVGFYATTITAALNVVLTYIFLYVIVPPMEYVVIGMVIIQAICGVVKLALTITYLVLKKIPVSFRFKFKWCKAILKVGVPATIAHTIYVVTSTLITRICVSLGKDSLQTRIYVQELVYYVYIFGYSIANANQIMIGRVCGMGDLDKADRMMKQNYKLVASFNVVFSLIFASFGWLILKYGYSASDAVVAIAVPVFLVDVFVELGRGINHVGQNGLNATGDVTYTSVVSIVAGFVCSVGLAYVLGIFFNLGLLGIWIAYAADEIVRATIYLVRWCRGGWRKSFKKELKHLEKTEQPA